MKIKFKEGDLIAFKISPNRFYKIFIVDKLSCTYWLHYVSGAHIGNGFTFYRSFNALHADAILVLKVDDIWQNVLNE